jgi:hypothetical protein
VLQLINDAKEQLNRKSFLDTHINELQKKSKTLGRSAVRDRRNTFSAEIRTCGRRRSASAASGGAANPEDLKATYRGTRMAGPAAALVASLEANITGGIRPLDGARSAEAVLKRR